MVRYPCRGPDRELTSREKKVLPSPNVDAPSKLDAGTVAASPKVDPPPPPPQFPKPHAFANRTIPAGKSGCRQLTPQTQQMTLTCPKFSAVLPPAASPFAPEMTFDLKMPRLLKWTVILAAQISFVLSSTHRATSFFFFLEQGQLRGFLFGLKVGGRGCGALG